MNSEPRAGCTGVQSTYPSQKEVGPRGHCQWSCQRTGRSKGSSARLVRLGGSNRWLLSHPWRCPLCPGAARGAERHLACPAQGKSRSASGPVLAEAMSPTTAPQPAPPATRNREKISQAFPMKSFPPARHAQSFLARPDAHHRLLPLAWGRETNAWARGRLGLRGHIHATQTGVSPAPPSAQAGTKHLYATPGQGGGPGGAAQLPAAAATAGCLDSPLPSSQQGLRREQPAGGVRARRLKKQLLCPKGAWG